MGIVIRQSFWSSIAGYLGVGIGYLNVVILMPKFLTPEEIGLYRTILSSAALFAPIPLFGLRSAFVRFFPRNNDGQNAALAILGLSIFLGLFGALALVANLFKPYIIPFFEAKAEAINDYLWLILVLIGLMGIYGFLESILKAKKDIAKPSFVRETLYKALQSVAVALVGFAIISVHQFLQLQYFIYVFISLLMLMFVLRRFSFKTKLSEDLKGANTKEFFTYARYALLSGLGTVAVLQIDQIMISKYLGLEANAIYTTAIFMAVVIEVPRRYLTQIAQPIMVQDFQANRLEKIHKDYKKASINQLIIGSYIFLGIVINLPNIYTLMPNGGVYEEGFWVVYIIGFAKLTNMAFSINGEIIVMSEHYRVNILLIAFLGIVTIGMNVLLIPIYGIEGAAYASLVTFFLFNFVKFLYIRKKFQFSPFSKWTIPTIGFLAILLFVNSLTGYLQWSILDILIRSGMLTLFYVGFVLIGKPSAELVNLWKMALSKLGFRR